MRDKSTFHRSARVQLILGAILLLAIAIVLIAYFVYAPGPPIPVGPCLQIPELQKESIRKPALELAAKLEAIPLDSHFKSNFEEMSKTTFQTLSEKQAAFLLLLRAIDCYMKSADTPEKQEFIQAIVPDLIVTVRAIWASEHELKGGGAERLSVREIDILEGSQYGPAVMAELKSHGVAL
jgi:hypothetical protein